MLICSFAIAGAKEALAAQFGAINTYTMFSATGDSNYGFKESRNLRHGQQGDLKQDLKQDLDREKLAKVAKEVWSGEENLLRPGCTSLPKILSGFTKTCL